MRWNWNSILHPIHAKPPQPQRPTIEKVGAWNSSVFPSSPRLSMGSITVYFPDVGELLQTAPVKQLSTIQAPRILSQQVDYDVAQISPTFSEAMEAVEEKLHSLEEVHESSLPHERDILWINGSERKYIEAYLVSDSQNMKTLPRCYLRPFLDPADQALFQLVGMGFPVQRARNALMKSDNGCRPCFNIALQILLSEQASQSIDI
jgi:hypothetical protein